MASSLCLSFWWDVWILGSFNHFSSWSDCQQSLNTLAAARLLSDAVLIVTCTTSGYSIVLHPCIWVDFTPSASSRDASSVASFCWFESNSFFWETSYCLCVLFLFLIRRNSKLCYNLSGFRSFRHCFKWNLRVLTMRKQLWHNGYLQLNSFCLKFDLISFIN